MLLLNLKFCGYTSVSRQSSQEEAANVILRRSIALESSPGASRRSTKPREALLFCQSQEPKRQLTETLHNEYWRAWEPSQGASGRKEIGPTCRREIIHSFRYRLVATSIRK